MSASTVFIYLIVAALGLFSVYLLKRHGGRKDQNQRVAESFGLVANDVDVLGYDVAGAGKNLRISLRRDGLIGSPDALFRRRANGQIVIGEFKARHYRGYVKPRELYQVLLYMGMATKFYRRDVEGVILFGCGSIKVIDWDPATYKWLLSLRRPFKMATIHFC